MFCYQCQEALNNQGCTKSGVCGKQPEVATLQDALIQHLKGLAWWLEQGRKQGLSDEAADMFILEGLFATVTNTNFDDQRFVELCGQAQEHLQRVQQTVTQAISGTGLAEPVPEAASELPSLDKETLLAFGANHGVLRDEDADIHSLKELIVYGLKGIAAYADHAYVLNHKNQDIFAFAEKALSATLRPLSLEEGLNLVMEAGKTAVDTMALLDAANTSAYGHPEVTQVDTSLQAEPAILISGHDLRDMEMLLEQSQDKGVAVYTHGEMLPANAYPQLKKYANFRGHFGTAWYNQREEFQQFNGPILFTTNCIVPPKEAYKDRVYTTGLVGWPGIKHIRAQADGSKDFSTVIEHALQQGNLAPQPGKQLTVGFAHNQVMQVADNVVEAVKSGDIKRFVVMAGCDGRHKSRQYYTEVAQQLPQDTVILTAGCAKFRYNHLDLGDIGGIPRILDAGQCNDSYSLAVIALKLKEAFGLEDINELPISYDIAWYEQKAVCVLLALLYLGVKGIRLGPTLPAFLSPGVAKVLVEQFEMKPIDEPQADIQAMLAGQ